MSRGVLFGRGSRRYVCKVSCFVGVKSPGSPWSVEIELFLSVFEALAKVFSLGLPRFAR